MKPPSNLIVDKTSKNKVVLGLHFPHKAMMTNANLTRNMVLNLNTKLVVEYSQLTKRYPQAMQLIIPKIDKSANVTIVIF